MCSEDSDMMTNEVRMSYVLPGVLAPRVAFRPALREERDRLVLSSALSPERRAYFMKLCFLPGALLLIGSIAISTFVPSWVADLLMVVSPMLAVLFPLGFLLTCALNRNAAWTIVMNRRGPIVEYPGQPPRPYAARRVRLVSYCVGNFDYAKDYQQLQCEILHESGSDWVLLTTFASLMNKRIPRSLAERWNVTLDVIGSPLEPIEITKEQWSALNHRAPEFPRVVSADHPDYTRTLPPAIVSAPESPFSSAISPPPGPR
jgi:hypothetical protein